MAQAKKVWHARRYSWIYCCSGDVHAYEAVINMSNLLDEVEYRVSVFASPSSVKVVHHERFATLDEARAWATAIVELR